MLRVGGQEDAIIIARRDDDVAMRRCGIFDNRAAICVREISHNLEEKRTKNKHIKSPEWRSRTIRDTTYETF